MYGTLRGALAGRKIAFDRESYIATVEGRITGIGKTIRIKSIHMKYELAVPAGAARPPSARSPSIRRAARLTRACRAPSR